MPNIITPLAKADAIIKLRQDILCLNGIKTMTNLALDSRLGDIKDAFPNGTFPIGAVHEFLSNRKEDATATSGFIAGLLGSLLGKKGAAIWISSSRTLFPPALKSFGINPDHIIFIDLKNERDAIWAMDEALKCGALSAVIGEVHEISFTSSKRLQLAVEQSHVTGFILRNNLRNLNTTACVSRWKISPLPSEFVDDLPGIGFPKWRVELLRIRNGKPGVWDIQWRNGKFKSLHQVPTIPIEQQKKTG